MINRTRPAAMPALGLVVTLAVTLTVLVAFPLSAQEAGSWVGSRVMAKTSDTPVKVGAKTAVTLNAGSVFRVERENADWLWVDSGNIQGWVKKADVVPFELAAAYFTAAVEKNPADDHAYVSRGLVWHASKAEAQAIADFTAAVAIDPKKPWPYHDRAVARHALGDFDRALSDAEVAVRLDPTGPTHLANRASIRYARKEFGAAVADYTEALRLLKGDEATLDDSAEPGSTRGRLLAAQWMCARAECWSARHAHEKAVADYSEAVRIDPHDAATINSLAWLLATSGDARFRNGLRAFELASRACTLTHFRDHLCLDTLAAAYAEAGDFAAAVKWQAAALSLAANDARFAGNYRARLMLFKERLPYHEGETR